MARPSGACEKNAATKLEGANGEDLFFYDLELLFFAQTVKHSDSSLFTH